MILRLLLLIALLCASVLPCQAQLSPFAHVGGLGLISTHAPVQREHPLAWGLVSMWRAIPGLDGGRQWYDLMSTHHGTLTNGATWGATVRTGGFGELRFDGVTTYVDVGLTSDFYASTQTTLTATIWLKPTTAALAAAQLRLFSFQRSTGSLGWALQTSGTGGMLEGRYRNVSNSNTLLTGATALDTGWHHGALVLNGTVVTLYLDGKQEGTASDMDSANTFLAGANLAALGSFDGSSNTWDGALDDARLYLRALSALDVAALYSLGRQGDTGLLNRGPLINVGGSNTAGFFQFMH